MPSKTRSTPSYLLHRGTGQARVRIEGKDHYLGRFGSPESRERYSDLISDWLVKQDNLSGCSLTVDDLALLYMDHAARYYRKDGQPTSEVHCTRLALRHAVTTHGRTRLRQFSPRKLKQVRQVMIDAGYVRSSVNLHVGRIKRMFRWAVENEYCPVEVYQALCAVTGLREGRSEAKESQPVCPVDHDTVMKTIPYLPTPVQAMVRLQWLTGARPGEICDLRPCDITAGDKGVWIYRPESHKAQHHRKERRIYIGPQGQEILQPFLERASDEYCFSPAESELARNALRRAQRESPMTPSQRLRKPKADRARPAKNRYTCTSYRRAVKRAGELAFGMPDELRNIRKALKNMPQPKQHTERKRLSDEAGEWRKLNLWTPNQLRHSRATLIREEYGIEAAQVVLGHSDCEITRVYAERDFAKAAGIMSVIG